MNRNQIALRNLHEGTVIPAVPLALQRDRTFDEQQQRTLIRYYLHAGVGGLEAAVHTTQFAIRNPDVGLFKPILQVVAEEVESFEKTTGKIIVKIAGVCGPINQVLQEAETAGELGYDAVLLSPGGLNRLMEEEMLHRTEKAASIMPVVGFYLQPLAGGRVFSYDYWERLCEVENVVAIKSAPFNRYQTIDVVRAAALSSRADEIALYTGNDDNILVDLLTKYRFVKDGKIFEKRFVGGLLGHWAVWAHTAVKLFEQIKEAVEKDIIPSELLTLAAEVTDANAAFFDAANNFAGCIAGVHEVLRRQGLLKGIWCLDKEETLSRGQREEIDRVYHMYPHLNDDLFISNNMGLLGSD